MQNDSSDLVFEEWFVAWVRTAFRAKGNVAVVQQLIAWSDTISKTGRETQKRFLEYCLQFFRQALLFNYKSAQLVFLETKTNFELSKLLLIFLYEVLSKLAVAPITGFPEREVILALKLL